MTKLLQPARRQFLRHSAGIAMAGTGVSLGSLAFASNPQAAKLSFAHTHTHEKISLIYSVAGDHIATALNRLNHFLRDHYSGTVGTMDPDLFDVLHRIKVSLNTQTSFHVISGYRSPATNEKLRTTRGGGVAKRSLHMDGKAIDVRLPGVPLDELRDAALSLKAGGVGFYPRSQFVHIDTGKVRSWGS